MSITWPWTKKKVSLTSEASRPDNVITTQEPTKTVSLHTSCKTLSLARFIPAYCNSNYSGLIISGEPTQEELQAAWNEILFDYSALIKNENSDYIFRLAKEIALTHWHITYVDNCCRMGGEDTLAGILHFRYDEDLIKELKKLGYKLTATFGTEKYFDQLSMINSLCKTKLFDLDELTQEHDRLVKTKSGKKQTEDEFMSTIIMLSKHQGYDIDAETTTVYKFTVIFNNYLTYKKIEIKSYEDGRG